MRYARVDFRDECERDNGLDDRNRDRCISIGNRERGETGETGILSLSPLSYTH
jgi:hypothetical protein